MALHQVDSIYVRQVTLGDFVNIERHPANGPTGGGGQLYIDIPVSPGGLPVERFWAFLGAAAGDPSDPTTWPETTLRVHSVGAPDEVANLEFLLRRGGNTRYRIANQNRQAPGSNRHPAWTAARGFPIAPDDIKDKNDPRIPDVSNTKIYIVKTNEGKCFAGYVAAEQMPADWPQGHGLEALFSRATSSRVLEYALPRIPEAPDLVNRILEAWRHSPNVLLYGPPGTGKTHAMQFVWDLLGSDTPLEALFLEDQDRANPFRTRGIELPFARPARREWTTFHQNYGYEDFILAHRPESINGGGFVLKPRLGTLLDAAVSVDENIAQEDELRAESAVVFVDEVNRGNVSRIFGEFITFMDRDYRAGPNSRPLPVPLPSVRAGATGATEPIARQRGAEVVLPLPWHFPMEVFMLASMNSVDRAVAPLDTALARRFARVEVGPDMAELAQWLRVTDSEALINARPDALQSTDADEQEDGDEAEGVPPDAPARELSAGETAFLLLYRLNYDLATLLGPDFELGHAYLRPVARAQEDGEVAAFRALARVWDQALYPQLRERLANRPAELLHMLRLDRQGAGPARYIIRVRAKSAGVSQVGASARPPLEVPSFEAAAQQQYADVVFSLRYLAGFGA